MDGGVEVPVGPADNGPVLRPARPAWFCRPPQLPGDTRGKRAADRVLRVMEVGGRFGVVVAVMAGQLIALMLPSPYGLVVSGVVSLLAGGYCAVNFWRCREAHCVISGVGWLVLGAFSLVAAGFGGSLIGGWEQTVFVAILGVAYLFEAGWRWRTGSNAVRGRRG